MVRGIDYISDTMGKIFANPLVVSGENMGAPDSSRILPSIPTREIDIYIHTSIHTHKLMRACINNYIQT
jgi:hypothetical protein